MSPDWAAKAISVPYAEFGDPQSLNLYSYVRNHPIAQVDADGHSMDNLTNIGFSFGGDQEGALLGSDDMSPDAYGWTSQGYKGSQQIQPTITYSYYSVSGDTPAEAASNANKMTNGEVGLTTVNYGAYVYNPSVQTTTKSDGGYSSTATPSDIKIDKTTIELKLPIWNGYANATAEQKTEWDKAVAALKHHEEGHVGIGVAGDEKYRSAISGGKGKGAGKTPDRAMKAALKDLQQQTQNAANKAREQVMSQQAFYDIITCHGVCQ